MILFHQHNVGREVNVNGKEDTIDYIRRDGQAFRIASEKDGPVVNDYGMDSITSARKLTVSFDNGVTWVDITNYTSAKKT